ncbi:MAG: MmcQ/YjbR family DNA-binding protein [Hyphomonadaceae bacterium]|nr:MmcQ/YjbR family DNA-binding protein [Hyphomonadaceae bacterium]
MATPADIRRAALALPEAIEIEDRHGLWFNVGKKTFILQRASDARWIFKLPKARQDFLFEVRPETFAPYRAGALLWAYVDVAALSRDEAKQLVAEAWTTIVPKKLSAPYLAPPK